MSCTSTEIELDGAPAYLALGGGSGANATVGVLVIHDIFCFNIPNSKYIADYLASQGFGAAVLPNLYNGISSLDGWPCTETDDSEPLEGSKWEAWWEEITMDGYWEPFHKRVDEAVAYLKGQCGCKVVCMIGLGWGGLAIEQLSTRGIFAQAASVHGCHENSENFLAAKDAGCTIAYHTVQGDESFEAPAQEALQDAGASVTIYEGMERGFAVRGDFSGDQQLKAAADSCLAAVVEQFSQAGSSVASSEKNVISVSKASACIGQFTSHPWLWTFLSLAVLPWVLSVPALDLAKAFEIRKADSSTAGCGHTRTKSLTGQGSANIKLYKAAEEEYFDAVPSFGGGRGVQSTKQAGMGAEWFRLMAERILRGKWVVAESLPTDALGSAARYPSCQSYLGVDDHSMTTCDDLIFRPEECGPIDSCPWKTFTRVEARCLLQGKWIAVIGDSASRMDFANLVHLVRGSLSSTSPGHGFPYRWGISPITGRQCWEGTDLPGGSDRCVLDELLQTMEGPIRLTYDFLTRMEFWPTIFPKVLLRHRSNASSSFKSRPFPDVVVFANGPWEFYTYHGLPYQQHDYFSGRFGYADALEAFLEDLRHEIMGNPLILWQGQLANLESGRKNLAMTNLLQQRALQFEIPFLDRSRMLVPEGPPGYVGDRTASEGGVHAHGPVSDATVNAWLNLISASSAHMPCSKSFDVQGPYDSPSTSDRSRNSFSCLIAVSVMVFCRALLLVSGAKRGKIGDNGKVWFHAVDLVKGLLTILMIFWHVAQVSIPGAVLHNALDTWLMDAVEHWANGVCIHGFLLAYGFTSFTAYLSPEAKTNKTKQQLLRTFTYGLAKIMLSCWILSAAYVLTHRPSSETGSIIADVMTFQAVYLYSDILVVFPSVQLIGVPLPLALITLVSKLKTERNAEVRIYTFVVFACLVLTTAVTWAKCDGWWAPYKAALFGCDCARAHVPVFPAVPLLVYYMSGMFIARCVSLGVVRTMPWEFFLVGLLLFILRLPLVAAWGFLWANLDASSSFGTLTRFPPSPLWVIGNAYPVFVITGLCYAAAVESLQSPRLFALLGDIRWIGQNSLVYLVVSSLVLYAVRERTLSVPESYLVSVLLLFGITVTLTTVRSQAPKRASTPPDEVSASSSSRVRPDVGS